MSMTREENELITRTGSGHAPGRSDAALLDSRGAVI